MEHDTESDSSAAQRAAGEDAEAKSKAAMAFAMDAFNRIPKNDREALEMHLTGTLIVFWGALWGTFGTEYAEGFIEAQLRGMQGDAEVFTPPRVQ